MTKHKNFNNHSFTTVKTTVAVILEKDGKVFLTKRSPATKKEINKWCIPGGHIEIGETAETAVIRELNEETSLKLSKPKFIFYFDEFIPRIKVHAINLIFTGKPSGKNHLSNEVSKENWFTKSQIKNLNMAFKHKEIIQRYFKEKK